MRIFNISIAAVAVLALAACDAGTTSNADDAATSNSDSAAPPTEVSAKELSAAFQDNEAKAKLQYDGKALKVSGHVKSIDLDFADDPVVSLVGAGDVEGMGVNSDGKMTDVAVGGLSKETAAEIKKGQDLTVICSGVDEVLGSPQLDGCALSS